MQRAAMGQWAAHAMPPRTALVGGGQLAAACTRAGSSPHAQCTHTGMLVACTQPRALGRTTCGMRPPAGVRHDQQRGRGAGQAAGCAGGGSATAPAAGRVSTARARAPHAHALGRAAADAPSTTTPLQAGRPLHQRPCCSGQPRASQQAPGHGAVGRVPADEPRAQARGAKEKPAAGGGAGPRGAADGGCAPLRVRCVRATLRAPPCVWVQALARLGSALVAPAPSPPSGHAQPPSPTRSAARPPAACRPCCAPRAPSRRASPSACITTHLSTLVLCHRVPSRRASSSPWACWTSWRRWGRSATAAMRSPGRGLGMMMMMRMRMTRKRCAVGPAGHWLRFVHACARVVGVRGLRTLRGRAGKAGCCSRGAALRLPACVRACRRACAALRRISD